RKQKSKMDALIEQLATIDGQGIIFCNTKFETWNVQKQLKANQHTAQVLQGDLPQIKRNLVLSAFREKKFQYLVATDLVSRGIDIDHVEIIIHYDIPASHHDYIHRIGRTSRGSVAGTSLALISQDQHDNWINIQNAINPSSNTKHNFSKKHKSSSRKKTHGPSASTKNKRKPRSKK
ncbi:MAG: C-terminal helicase domain-containing protein, partial [Bdellovibrionota bacterium]